MSKIITDAATLNKTIAGIAKASAALVKEVQIALVSSTFHAVAHGNVGPINSLIEAMGKGMRRTAAAQWLVAFAPVVPNDNKEQAKEQPFKFSREKVEALTGEAKPDAEVAEAYAETTAANNWIDYKEPPLVPETVDIADLIRQVLKKAKGLEEKGSKVTHGELLAKLSAILPPAGA